MPLLLVHPAALVQALILLTLANGTPVVVKKLLGNRGAWPLDGGARFLDGQPLLGSSKTVRGVALAILATALGARLLGFPWRLGLAAGAAAMAGDLFSSFVKRRLRLTPSSRASGLDQIPEALLPLLACRGALALSAADIAAGVLIFLVGEVLLSRLLFRLKLRDRPY